jgi:hypothetical protein
MIVIIQVGKFSSRLFFQNAEQQDNFYSYLTGCETWAYILNAEYKLHVSGNKFLKKVLGCGTGYVNKPKQFMWTGNCAGFEVLTAMVMKNKIFWYITPYSSSVDTALYPRGRDSGNVVTHRLQDTLYC